jgi:hypothetical protein
MVLVSERPGAFGTGGASASGRIEGARCIACEETIDMKSFCVVAAIGLGLMVSRGSAYSQ